MTGRKQRPADPQVGDGIAAPGGVWSFGGADVAAAFDQHVAVSVPDYDGLQRLLARLAAYHLVDGAPVVDYGCATGRTLEEIRRANPGRSPRLVGVDDSAAMCARARARLPDAEVRCLGIAHFPPPPDTCLLLGVYTLQFLAPSARADALKAWAAAVRPGTALFLVEKTVADDPLYAVPFSDVHHDEKLEHFTAAEVTEKARSLRGVLRPLPARETEAMLDGAGWRYQRFWQHLAFVGWACTRR